MATGNSIDRRSHAYKGKLQAMLGIEIGVSGLLCMILVALSRQAMNQVRKNQIEMHGSMELDLRDRQELVIEGLGHRSEREKDDAMERGEPEKSTEEGEANAVQVGKKGTKKNGEWVDATPDDTHAEEPTASGVLVEDSEIQGGGSPSAGLLNIKKKGEKLLRIKKKSS